MREYLENAVLITDLLLKILLEAFLTVLYYAIPIAVLYALWHAL